MIPGRRPGGHLRGSQAAILSSRRAATSHPSAGQAQICVCECPAPEGPPRPDTDEKAPLAHHWGPVRAPRSGRHCRRRRHCQSKELIPCTLSSDGKHLEISVKAFLPLSQIPPVWDSFWRPSYFNNGNLYPLDGIFPEYLYIETASWFLRHTYNRYTPHNSTEREIRGSLWGAESLVYFYICHHCHIHVLSCYIGPHCNGVMNYETRKCKTAVDMSFHNSLAIKKIIPVIKFRWPNRLFHGTWCDLTLSHLGCGEN